MRRQNVVAVLGLAPAVMVAGCGASSESNTPAATPTPRDCGRLSFPYPTADATLMANDTGKSVQIPVGGLVEVDLSGSPSRRWSPITLTGFSVVSLSTKAMTPTVGSRLGEYCAVQKGAATLNATDGVEQWTASISVH